MPRVTYMTGVVPTTLPRTGSVADAPATGEAAWAEAVAKLARRHRARLAEPDPTRPWLGKAVAPSGAAQAPGSGTSRRRPPGGVDTGG